MRQAALEKLSKNLQTSILKKLSKKSNLRFVNFYSPMLPIFSVQFSRLPLWIYKNEQDRQTWRMLLL